MTAGLATDRWLLGLVARLPFASVRHLVALGGRGRVLVYRRAARLIHGGLVGWIPGPAPGGTGRSPRLLYPTVRGVQLLAGQAGADPAALARQLRLRRVDLVRRLAELPSVLASYELLARLALAGPGVAHLRSWEQPWRRSYQLARHRRPQVARMVAAAGLTWTQAHEEYTADLLLLPDTGGLAIPAFRAPLGRLVDLRRATGQPLPTLVVATTSAERVRAWSRLVERVSRVRGSLPLTAHVTTWPGLARPLPGSPEGQPTPRDAPAAPTGLAFAGRVANGGFLELAGGVGSGTGASWSLRQGRRSALGVSECAVLDLVGRHPFLSSAVLANVLARDTRWVARRRGALLDRGLLRMVTPEEVRTTGPVRGALLELTVDGLRVLAAHLGLPLATAVVQHGLAGGGPQTPIGARRILLAHLAHTLGADAVFGMLARAARAWHGGALVEWRNAATCAHGRLRPDGYGLLRFGRREYGFFLEFDRGTVRTAALRAKFAAYHRYLESGRAARDYDGAPTVLVVTAGPGAEQRVIDAVLAAHVDQPRRLPLLVTTADLLAAAARGPFDGIWRVPGSRGGRRSWPDDAAW